MIYKEKFYIKQFYVSNPPIAPQGVKINMETLVTSIDQTLEDKRLNT